MRRMKKCILVYLALAGISFAFSAFAENCEFTSESTLGPGPGQPVDLFYENIELLSDADCFGGTADESQLTQQILTAIQEINTATRKSEVSAPSVDVDSAGEPKDRVLSLLEDIRKAMTVAIGKPEYADWSKDFQVMLSMIDRSIERVNDDYGSADAQNWELTADYHLFDEGDRVFAIDYKTRVDTACHPNLDFETCKSALLPASEIVRLATLTYLVLDIPVRDHIKRIQAVIGELDDRWDYYWEKARSQYFWELAWNDSLYNPKPNTLEGPPDGQVIAMHFSGAAEYVSKLPKNASDINTVALVELIGYNWLRWPERGEKRTWKNWPIGISVIASWAPGAAGDKVGYGGMIYINNVYQFGVTWRDTGLGKTEPTWVLSMDVMKLFLEKKKEARDKFQLSKFSDEAKEKMKKLRN